MYQLNRSDRNLEILNQCGTTEPLDCWESFSGMPSTELVECWVARKFEFTSPLVYSQLLVQYRLDEMLQNRDILQTDKIASESDYLRSDHDVSLLTKCVTDLL